MDLRDLRYFREIAIHSSVRKAAASLNISPGSLSKAIQRLEDELNVALVEHRGRQIDITASGRLLEERANDLLNLELAAKQELSGEVGDLNIALGGEEILLTHFGTQIIKRLAESYSLGRVTFRGGDDRDSLMRVARREIHFAVVTSVSKGDFRTKIIDEASFSTCVGRGHPLYRRAKAGEVIHVEEVLQHGFVSPDRSILGRIAKSPSFDGWRDDKFPRNIKYRATSLALIEELILGGLAVAYLPDYYRQHIGAVKMAITGCPYTCEQKIRLIVKKPIRFGWLNALF